jgi:cytochrome c biogenesis protein
MKFAIVLLVIIAIVSVAALFIGEFYPVRASGPGWQEFWQKQLGINKTLFNFLTFLEIHDPYRSWWYQILLGLLSLSLFACILDRLPIVIRSMRISPPRDSVEIEKMPSAKKLNVSRLPDQVRRSMPPFFSYREEKHGDEIRLAGQRSALGYIGPILAHIGMLGLVLGGIISSLGGYNTQVAGLPGEVVKDSSFDFSVRIDSFMITYHPLGIGQYVLVDNNQIGKIVDRGKGELFKVEVSPEEGVIQVEAIEASRLRNQFDIQNDRGNIKSYITILTVLENEQEKLTKRIEVNHPLRYKGFRFYQASFDPDHPRVESSIDSAQIVIKSAADGAVIDTAQLRFGVPLRLPDGNDLVLARFLPDFRLEGNKPVSASAQMRNPAVLLEVRQNDQELYHQWAFLRADFPHTASAATYSFSAGGVFGFSSSITYPTILEVNKNPGSWIIWLGFILCTVGLALAFYLTPQRLWVVIRNNQKGSIVHIAGSTTRNPDLFRQRFEHWIEQIQKGS